MRSVVLLVAITLALGAQAAPAATEDPPPAGFDPATHAAIVGAAPLLLNDFGHWMNLLYAGRLSAHRKLLCPQPPPGRKSYAQDRDAVMTFLVRGAWIAAEAAERGIKSPATEVRRALERARRQAFPRPGEYDEFLRTTCQSEADLLYRQRIQILERRVIKNVQAPARTGRGRQRLLVRFGTRYEAKWRARTYCAPGYVIAECSNSPNGTLPAP